MDKVDRAQFEQEQLDKVCGKERAKNQEEQLIVDGVVTCVDCAEPVGKARLEANPSAVRCIFCQRKKELKERQYRGY